MIFKRKDKIMRNVQEADKPAQLNIWVTEDIRDRLHEMAAADDRSVSSFMRMLIKREIKNYDRKG